MTTTLPSAARSKLGVIQGQAADARDAAASAQRRISHLSFALSAHELLVEEATHMRTELQRLEAVREKENKRHRAFADLAAKLSLWLNSQPHNAVLELAKPVPAKLAKGEALSDAIARVRSEIDKAQFTLREVRMAPRPKTALRAEVKAVVAELAKLGRPTISTERGELAVSFTKRNAFGLGDARIAEILAWCDPERLEKALIAEIDAMPETRRALSAADKAARLAELSSEIDRLERLEEAFIESALAEGQDVLRRTNASAAAVLGVIAKTKKEAAAA